MIGTQFYANTLSPLHPCHTTLSNPTHHRLKQPPSSPGTFYQQIFNNIPPPINNTSITKHIHTHLTALYLRNRKYNNILNLHPPPINTEFETLPTPIQFSIAKLRCGHHPNLQSYKYRFNINQATHAICNRCNRAPDTVSHLLLHCPNTTQSRETWGIHTVMDLWTSPSGVANFLSEVWPPQ